MQGAFLDQYSVPTPVEIGPHSFTIQPYHSPTSQDIIGNSAIFSSYPLTSHEQHLLSLDTSGYPPILPKPPPLKIDDSKIETYEVGQAYAIDDVVPEAEYVNPQCVIFTFYTGDVNSVVDEHFKRSLSKPSSFSNEPITRDVDEDDHSNKEDGNDSDQKDRNDSDQKDGNDSGIETNESPVQESHKTNKKNKDADDATSPLMCFRKFPPSFWNCNYWREIRSTPILPYEGTGLHYLNGSSGVYYQSDLNNASTLYRGSDLLFHSENYSTFRQRGPTDPWSYAYSTHLQSAFSDHKPSVYELSNTAGGPFNPRYSSLLIQPTIRSTLLPAVPGQMEPPKPAVVSDNWSPGYNAINNSPKYSEVPTYNTDAPSIDDNDTLKDLLWF